MPQTYSSPEGNCTCHSVRIALDKGELDTVCHVVLAESIDSIPDVLIEMTVWMIGRSRISSSFQCPADDCINRWVCWSLRVFLDTIPLVRHHADAYRCQV